MVENGGILQKPVNGWQKAACESQMVRNVAGYQNFSTVGVVVILVLGGLLVLVGWWVDVLTAWVQGRWKSREGEYRRLSWVADGYLQLQRLAWEGVGVGEWGGCDELVPVMRDEKGELMRVPRLDVEDSTHPYFSRGTAMGEDVVGKDRVVVRGEETV